jgi:putative membrane protein
MWHTGDGMGWWMLFGSLWFIILSAGIIWVLFRSRVDGRPSADNETAMDIARKRYARGEISREQFEALKRDLES